MIRKAKAVWRGTGRAGSGHLSTESGVLAETSYSFKTRFENERGTNPEELIAAAHAGCFAMALAFGLEGAGFTPQELRVQAVVTIEKEGAGWTVRSSDLKLDARVPGINEAQFRERAEAAQAGCPISRLLSANITLDAKLSS